MGIKYTYEQVKMLFEHRGYELISDCYKNSKTKLKAIDRDGYFYDISLTNLLSGFIPCKVGRNNPYTIINIQNFLNINDSGITLKTEEFISSDNPLILLCTCGNEYKCSYNVLHSQRKFLCNKCQTKNIASKNRLNIEFLKEQFIRNNYIPLFNSYTNTEERLLCKDANGFEGLLSYDSLMRNNTISRYSIYNPHTIKNIKHYIAINNLSCELISDKFEGCSSDLIFRCECGNLYKISWTAFISKNNGIMCQNCSRKISKYQFKVNTFLKEHNINFISEYKIANCRNIYPLPFDYAILDKEKNLKFLIELDGEQHFKAVNAWGGNDAFIRGCKRDEIKNKYCNENNIELLRIPYYNFKNYKNLILLKLIEHNIFIDKSA